VTASSAPVLVTGATGNVGSAVVTELAAAGVPVRAGVHGRPTAGGPPGGEPVHLDFTDPSTFGTALSGVHRVFLLRPPPIARVGPTINRFLDAAADAGVEHVVFSSVVGAGTNRIVPHHRIERHLRASGLGWTILRPGFFAQNLGGAYRVDVEQGRIHVPAGDGRVAFVDVRDLGALAAAILADPAPHAEQAYTVTGPAAVTFAEVAQLLSHELGRAIVYEPATAIGYLRHLGAGQLPIPQRLVQAVLHLGIRRGDAERVDPTLAQLLGRPPRTIATYIHDHAHLW
jgi:uncharacterized protein YbjT (DUF2867 family)